MHNFHLLEILAIGFSLALVFGFLTHKLKLSPIVGYLLAGFLIGPYSPGFVADAELAGQLAEVGVILLMFGVGLHFNLKDLLSVWKIAIPGAITQSAIATALCLAVALWYGLSASAGLMLGFAISVASTVVLIRVLMDNNMLDSAHGHIAVGWLIVEDIFTVFILVLLPVAGTLTQTGGNAGFNVLLPFGTALAKLALLWILILPVGGRIIPWIVSHVARSRSTELFTLTILVLAFVIATGSAMIFGVSVALGAFLAGMVVGKTKVSHQAATDILPMRDAFSVLFFLSIGMLFDPGFILQRPGLALALLGIILIAKPLVAGLVVVLLGYSVRTSLTVAIGLAQIGEFSFILAQQAQSLGFMSKEDYSALVACALISISLNPLFFRGINPLEKWLRNHARLWDFLSRRAERKGNVANLSTTTRIEQNSEAPRAIVIGYGPVGRRVAVMLNEHNIQTVIIDLNVDTINSLQSQGRLAVYGDGSRPSILQTAGIDRAKYLLVTLPDLISVVAAVSNALSINPDIKVFARARYLGARSILDDMGVITISFEEEEVAKAMTDSLLDKVREDSGVK